MDIFDPSRSEDQEDALKAMSYRASFVQSHSSSVLKSTPQLAPKMCENDDDFEIPDIDDDNENGASAIITPATDSVQDLTKFRASFSTDSLNSSSKNQ